MSLNDRRKHRRYQVRKGTFAAVPSNFLIGEVKNLSLGGFSFTCVAPANQSFSYPVLEIFSKDNDFYLREIPFNVVSETNLESQVPCSTLQMRQISGKFADLTEYQKSMLDFFIRNLTKAGA